MNNKRNIVVMFLFVMLSFAIVSEVSAVSDAEADGTGFDPSLKSVNVTDHDIAGESNMQDHDDDFISDAKSHNEQNSFNNTPGFMGDKDIENENFYEHDMEGNHTSPSDFDGIKPLDFNDSMGNLSIPPLPDNLSENLRNGNFTAVPGGEAMDDVISNLIGLNNISPNFKKDDKNLFPGNVSDPKPAVGNVTDQPGPDDKNSSAMLPADIKDSKNIKSVKKPKKAKKVKKAKKAKKIKPAKKAKKVKKSKKLNKNSRKERAKL